MNAELFVCGLGFEAFLRVQAFPRRLLVFKVSIPDGMPTMTASQPTNT